MNFAIPADVVEKFIDAHLPSTSMKAAVKVDVPCPKCGRSDNVDVENGIYYCHDCRREF